MTVSENQLRTWVQPASATEEQKCERATSMIKRAVHGSTALSGRSYRVIAQGSYENNTNARTNSDVDVCVVFDDVCYTDFTYAPSESWQGLGLTDSSHSLADDRRAVEQALIQMFGRSEVKAGNKTIDIRSNTARVDADVVVAYEFRGYQPRSIVHQPRYTTGLKFFTQEGQPIINFPEQHLAVGRAKNVATRNQFKYATRIIKHTRYEMLEADIPEADGVSSFLLECAMSNVPNYLFDSSSTWSGTMQNILHYMHEALRSGEAHNHWREVSEEKWLFLDSYRIPANWTPTQLQTFVLAAYNHLIR